MYPEKEHNDDNRLQNLNTKGGFTVPVGYFTRMRDHVLQQTTGQAATTTFSVPDGYFEKSRQKILRQTIQKPVMEVWYKRSLVKYAAAILAVSLPVSLLIFRQPASAGLQSMTDEEIIHYIEEDGGHDIPVTEVSFAVNEPTVNSEEKYLLNNADEQSIIEEL